MPSKAEFYRQMAQQVSTQLVGSWKEWTAFLTTAARLYKYPFHEQIMNFTPSARMPPPAPSMTCGMKKWDGMCAVAPRVLPWWTIPATSFACAMCSIFPIPAPVNIPVHLVVAAGRTARWACVGHAGANYGVAGDNLAQQLTDVAGELASEYWDDHARDFRYIVDGSFLAEYDDYNIEVQFKSAATVSIAYALMSRCGLDTEQYFQHEDFMPIFDFNTRPRLGHQGAAVSQINQQVLRQIGVTIQIYEREQLAERTLHMENSLTYTMNGDYQIPDLKLTEQPEKPLGEYRMMRKAYLKEHRPLIYNQLSCNREAVPAPHRDRREQRRAVW